MGEKSDLRNDEYWCGNKYGSPNCHWRELIGASTTSMEICRGCFDLGLGPKTIAILRPKPTAESEGDEE